MKKWLLDDFKISSLFEDIEPNIKKYKIKSYQIPSNHYLQLPNELKFMFTVKFSLVMRFEKIFQKSIFLKAITFLY